MRLHDTAGNRFYLNAKELAAVLAVANPREPLLERFAAYRRLPFNPADNRDKGREDAGR